MCTLTETHRDSPHSDLYLTPRSDSSVSSSTVKHGSDVMDAGNRSTDVMGASESSQIDTSQSDSNITDGSATNHNNDLHQERSAHHSHLLTSDPSHDILSQRGDVSERAPHEAESSGVQSSQGNHAIAEDESNAGDVITASRSTYLPVRSVTMDEGLGCSLEQQDDDADCDVISDEAMAATAEVLVHNEQISLPVKPEVNVPDVNTAADDSKFADTDIYPVPQYPKIRLAAKRSDIIQKSESAIPDSDTAQDKYSVSDKYPVPEFPKVRLAAAREVVIAQMKNLENFDEEPKTSARSSSSMYDIIESEEEEDEKTRGDNDHNDAATGARYEVELTHAARAVVEDVLQAVNDEEREERRMREELRYMALLGDVSAEQTVGAKTEQTIGGKTVKTVKANNKKTIKEKIKATFTSSKKTSNDQQVGSESGGKDSITSLLSSSSDIALKATLAPFRQIWSNNNTDTTADTTHKQQSGDVTPSVIDNEPNRKSIAEEMSDVTRSSESSSGSEVFGAVVKEDVIEQQVRDHQQSPEVADSSRSSRYFSNPAYESRQSTSSTSDDNARGLSYYDDLLGDDDPVTSQGQGPFDDYVVGLDQLGIEPFSISELESRRRSTLKHEPLGGDISSLLNLSDVTSRCEDKCVGTDEEPETSWQSFSHSANSQRIVVSKFSTDVTAAPTNQTSAVTMFIDNGEIRDIQNADAVDASGQVIPGRYETYEINPSLLVAMDSERAREGYGPTGQAGYYTHYGPQYDSQYTAVDPQYWSQHDSGYTSHYTTSVDESGKTVSQLHVQVTQPMGGPSYSYGPDPRGAADDMNASALSGYSDVSEHQVLCTMLKQSDYYAVSSC